MTWHAPCGEIVLAGNEREIFQESILSLCNQISDTQCDEDCSFGAASVFDSMSRTQQIASLEQVASYLFWSTERCLALTAWSEATLATILGEIRADLIQEIDGNEDDRLRTAIIESVSGIEARPGWNNHEDWIVVMDAYDDRFLWDNDYENTILPDLPTDAARHIRGVMGIDDEYHSAIPPDLASGWELRHGKKMVWIAMDGKKTLKMTATLQIEVPASLKVQKDQDGVQTVLGVFPVVMLMQDLGNGDAIQASESVEIFFEDGSLQDHWIEDVANTDHDN